MSSSQRTSAPPRGSNLSITPFASSFSSAASAPCCLRTPSASFLWRHETATTALQHRSRARSPRTQNCPDRRKSNAALLRKMPTELPAPRNCRLRHRQLVEAANQRCISGKRRLLAWRHPLPPTATRNLQFLQRATPSTTYLTIWHRPPGARHTSSLPTAPLSAPHQRSSDTQRHRKFIQTIT